ncbi:DUF4865 family protein [Celerinatantimonas sp. MCCC 1A17872]|uniref:DUF4865 family protein n=1 Tax=Celerinatantimonas sp. MCCC 1A17872 TaxID=3177514 RepID=UPI0038C25854
MIAMQYRFVLPGDYDMDLIEQRIHNNAHLLNGFSELVMKFYLYARRDDKLCQSSHNIYAPLYLFAKSSGINEFLASSGFANLCQHFSRPSIALYLVEHSDVNALERLEQFSIALSDYAAPKSADETAPILAAHNYERWQTLQVMADDCSEVSDMVQHYRVGYVAKGSAYRASL